MINTPTVLILGAGASHPYRHPLGMQMVEGILKRIDSEPNRFTDAGVREGDLRDFQRKLRKADLTSIDAFLEDNEDEYVRIGKLAIANEILRAEDSEVFFFGGKRAGGHWYQYLWNYMHEGATKETIPQNQLSVVTFNYDRSFEHYFATVLQHRFNLQRNAEAFDLLRRSIKMVHLHGDVGDHPYGSRTSPTADQLRRAAEGIRIVHDDAGDHEFANAHELISKATVVCFLGFGYHPTNIKRLDVQSHFTKKPLYGSVKGLMEAEVRRAEGHLQRSITTADVDSLDFLRTHPVLR